MNHRILTTPLVFTLSAVLFSCALHAQNMPPPHPQPDSVIRIIPTGEGRDTYNLYTIGGRLVTAGEVKEKLAGYPPSAGEYSIARHNLTAARITLAGTILASTGAVFAFADNVKDAGAKSAIVNGQATIIYQHHNLAGAYILTGVAVGLLTTSIITFVTASHHSRQALRVYNHRFE